MRLGQFLAEFGDKLQEGNDSGDGCVLCGSKTKLLHPVEQAWACSGCHTPPTDSPAEEE